MLGYGATTVKENDGAEDISEQRSFSRIMQQSLNSELEHETAVDSSKKGIFRFRF